MAKKNKSKNKKEIQFDINKFFLPKINRIPAYVFDCNIVNVDKKSLDKFVNNSSIKGLAGVFARSSESMEMHSVYKTVFKDINFENIKFIFNTLTIDFYEPITRVRTLTHLKLNDNILTINTFTKEFKVSSIDESIKEIEDHIFSGSIDITTNKFFDFKIRATKQVRSVFSYFKTNSSKLKYLDMQVYRAFMMSYILIGSIDEASNIPKEKIYKIKSKKYKIDNNSEKNNINSERIIDLSKPNKTYVYKENNGEKRDYNYTIESFSRKGHWRTYKSGKRIWIEASIVNPGQEKTKEIKHHEYKL